MVGATSIKGISSYRLFSFRYANDVVKIILHLVSRHVSIAFGTECTGHEVHNKLSLHGVTRWLYCVECPQYRIWLEAVSYLCTSCLLLAFDDAQCHVTATEWCQRYLPCYSFTVWNSGLLFFSQAASALLGLANIGHQTLSKIWVGFLYGAYCPGELFWIDSNGKNGN